MCCIALLLSYAILLCRMEAAILLIGAFWCGNYANLIAANNDMTIDHLMLYWTRILRIYGTKLKITAFVSCSRSSFLQFRALYSFLREYELMVFARRLRLDAQGREQMSIATFARFPEDLGLFLDHGANINQDFNYCSMLSEFGILRLSDS